MRKGRLVTRFGPVNKSVVGNLKRLNECQQVSQNPQEWEIFVGTSEGIFPPEGMIGVVSDYVLGHTARQQIIIFESETEVYVTVCHYEFITKVKDMAATTDSKKVFAYVRQLAP